MALERDAFVRTLRALTLRQRDVLVLVARQHRNPDIADALGITVHTVENYVSELVDRFDCRDRAELLLTLHRYLGSA